MSSVVPGPRRVHLVVWWFDEFGGMEEQVTTLACALARRGVEVVVFSEMPLPPANAYRRRLHAAGVRVHAPPLWLGWIRKTHGSQFAELRRLAHALEAGCLGALATLRRLGGAIRGPVRVKAEDEWVTDAARNILGSRLLRSLERERSLRPADVVHVHGCRLGQVWVLRWAASRAIASVYTEHLTIEGFGGPADPRAAEALLESADAITCVSERARRSLRTYLPPAADVVVTRHIVPSVARNARSRPAGEPLAVLCVARLAKPKGVDVLLRAVAALAPERIALRLTLVGDGPERSALATLADSLGIAALVHFVGALERAAVARFLADADLVVLPSRTEGLPVLLLEALAHGKAIIASHVGGIPEVITDGDDGRLVEAEDVDALAAALRDLACDESSRARLGAAARASFERGRWDEDAVVADLFDLYRRAMRPHGSTRSETVEEGSVGGAASRESA